MCYPTLSVPMDFEYSWRKWLLNEVLVCFEGWQGGLTCLKIAHFHPVTGVMMLGLKANGSTLGKEILFWSVFYLVGILLLDLFSLSGNNHGRGWGWGLLYVGCMLVGAPGWWGEVTGHQGGWAICPRPCLSGISWLEKCAKEVEDIDPKFHWCSWLCPGLPMLWIFKNAHMKYICCSLIIYALTQSCSDLGNVSSYFLLIL